MKTKHFALITGLLLSFNLVNSQTEYGISAGLINSRFTNKFKSTNGSYFNMASIGLNIGGFAEIGLSNNITFYPKLEYNQIGDREKNFDNSPSTYELDYKLDYLTLALNTKFFKKPYVFIGPQISLLVNTKKSSNDFGDIDNNIDVGGNIGFGYEFNMISIEVSTYQGLIDIMKIERGSNSSWSDQFFRVRNSYLNFSLKYKISK